MLKIFEIICLELIISKSVLKQKLYSRRQSEKNDSFIMHLSIIIILLLGNYLFGNTLHLIIPKHIYSIRLLFLMVGNFIHFIQNTGNVLNFIIQY